MKYIYSMVVWIEFSETVLSRYGYIEGIFTRSSLIVALASGPWKWEIGRVKERMSRQQRKSKQKRESKRRVQSFYSEVYPYYFIIYTFFSKTSFFHFLNRHAMYILSPLNLILQSCFYHFQPQQTLLSHLFIASLNLLLIATIFFRLNILSCLPLLPTS